MLKALLTGPQTLRGALRRTDAALWLLLAVQLASQLLYFFGSPGGFAADEGELNQPTAAWLALHGHMGRLPFFQYTSFCGGCTLESLLAMPLFVLGGPVMLLWKLVPWGFSAAVLATGYSLIRRHQGQGPAACFGLWMVFAPSFYLHCAQIGFASHVEVMAFVLLAMLSWDQLLRRGAPRYSLLLGLILGLGFWFCYTSAFALPVLLGLWALLRPQQLASRRSALLGAGLAAGLVPWLAILLLRRLPVGGSPEGFRIPLVEVYGRGLLQMLDPTSLPERWGEVFGASYWASLYAPALGPERSIPGLAVSIALQLGLVWAVALGLRRLVAGRDALRARPLELALPLATLAFVAAYLLLEPQGLAARTGSEPPRAPNAMRYLAPTVPLFGLCLAWAGGWGWRRGGAWRALAGSLALVVLGVGVTARLATLRPERLCLRALHLPALDWTGFQERVARPALRCAELEEAGGAGFIEELAEERWTRQFQLLSAGHGLTRPVLRAAEAGGCAGLDPWLAGMPIPDQRSLLEGLALGLVEVNELVLEPQGFPGPQVAGVLADLSDERACQLMRELLRLRPPSEEAFAALRQERFSSRQALSAGQDACREQTLAWAWGRRTVADSWSGLGREVRAAPETMAEATRSRLDVPLRLRSSFVEGLGASIGGTWGYQAALRPRLGGGLPPEEQAAFLRGYDDSAHRSFLWH